MKHAQNFHQKILLLLFGSLDNLLWDAYIIFLSDWNFVFCKGPQSKKKSLFTHDLVPSLVYKPSDGNTGIMILMPTFKCSLAVAGSSFLPVFDLLFSVVKCAAFVNQSWFLCLAIQNQMKKLAAVIHLE